MKVRITRPAAAPGAHAQPPRTTTTGTADTGAAAYRAAHGRIRRQQDVILELLAQRGEHGATSYETHEETGIMYPSAAAALSKLANEGLIHATGALRVNTTNDATVWALGPAPPESPPLRRRVSASVLKREIDELRALLAEAQGRGHRCWNCDAEIELAIDAEDVASSSSTQPRPPRPTHDRLASRMCQSLDCVPRANVRSAPNTGRAGLP